MKLTQTSSDFGVQGTRMTSLVYTVQNYIVSVHGLVHGRRVINVPEHALQPCDNFVRRRVRRLILLIWSADDAQVTDIVPGQLSCSRRSRETNQVNEAVGNVRLDVAFEGRRAVRNGSEVAGADQQIAVILKQQWPCAGINGRSHSLRLDRVLFLHIHLVGHL